MFRSKNHFINCLLFIWCAQIFVIEFAACDSCWSSDSCEIHATYYGEQNAIDESRSYKCDRVDDIQMPGTDLPPDSLHNFITTKNVSLNGCSAPLNAHTYGMEYLPNCDSLLAVTIERFQTDQLLPLKCSRSSSNHLKYLKFKQNDVSVVDSRAFEQLVDLEQLSFISNTLQYIEQGAFDELRSLKFLSMENEQNYYLNVNGIFWNTSIEYLQLMGLKGIHSEVFQNLPESLRDLHVEHTPIENNAIELENPKELSRISLTNCELHRFILSDSFGSVLLVNLSGNALGQLDFGPNNLHIETLDLSFNHLEKLPNEWISHLSNLRELLLHNNIIKTLSLEALLGLSPSEPSRDLMIDLSVNQLSSFKEVNPVRSSELFMLRLKVDRNPWNCMWLIEFSYKHPHLFHLFQYDKYISRINVNGLECVAVEQLPEADELAMSSDEVPSTAEKDENYAAHNTAHYVVGGPWEVKRNQRAEALIIVFMLPLGIAFLFLLLYLWIYCHKLFSLSYYQSMSKSHETNGNSDTKAGTEVKPLTIGEPTSDADGYEVPLNIDLPIYRQTLANDDVTKESLKKNYEVVNEVEKPKNGGLQPLYEYLPDY